MKDVNDRDGLCNNCLVAEERRNPKKGEIKMSTIDVLVKCPQAQYAQLEEHCLKDGKDLSTFILYCALEKLHLNEVEAKAESQEQPQRVEDKKKVKK